MQATDSLSVSATCIVSIRQALEHNHLIKARQLCEAAIKDFPEDTAVSALYGSLLLQSKDYPAAIAMLERGLPATAFDLGVCYANLKEYEKALQYYLLADSFQGYREAAQLYADKMEPAQSLPLFEKAAAYSEKVNTPALSSCYLKWGTVLYTMNLFQEAEVIYEKVMDLGPQNQSIFNNLAMLHIATKRFESAAGFLLEGIRLYPEDPEAFFNMARLKDKQGLAEETMNWLEQAMQHGFNDQKRIRNEITGINQHPRFGELLGLLNNSDYWSCKSLFPAAFADRPYRYTRLNPHYSAEYGKQPLLPSVIYQAINLKSIEIEHNFGIKHVCKEISQLKKLKKLHITDNPLEDLPAELNDFELDDVLLEMKNQSEFPSFLAGLNVSKDFSILLNNLKVDHIPDEIASLFKLTQLGIRNSKMETCSAEIASLYNLVDLSINNTALKSIPSSIRYMRELKNLTLTDNAQLSVLPPETALIPNLRLDQVIFTKNGFPNVEAEQLFREAHELKTERSQLAINLALLQHQTHYLQEHATLENVLPALNSQTRSLRNNALLWLTNKLKNGMKEHPLREGAEVWLPGKFTATSNQVKEIVKACGATIVSRLTSSTTHILIGEKPGDAWQQVLNSQAQLLTEELLQPADEQETFGQVLDYPKEYIEFLLFSTAPTNVDMALEIIQDGKSAKDWLEELFIAFQFIDDKQQKSNIQFLLKQYGSTALQAALTVKYHIAVAADAKISEALDTIHTKTGLDMQRMAFAILRFTNHREVMSAVKFILEKGESWLKYKLLERMISRDGVLNLTNYGNHLTSLPEELIAFPQIKNLNLARINIKELPELVLQLTELEVLDLSGCKIKKLPAGISQLRKLRQLILSNCSFKKFPEELCALSNLEVLCLDRTSQRSVQELSDIPDSIRSLQQLRMLDLCGNPLKIFPEVLTELKALEVLNIHDTMLTSLPGKFSELTHCRVLEAGSSRMAFEVNYDRRNNFINLPEAILQLPNLEKLYIYDDRIGEFIIASKFLHMKKLTRLFFCHTSKEQLEAFQLLLPELNVAQFDYYKKEDYL